jgi:hypothetical protein
MTRPKIHGTQMNADGTQMNADGTQMNADRKRQGFQANFGRRSNVYKTLFKVHPRSSASNLRSSAFLALQAR